MRENNSDDDRTQTHIVLAKGTMVSHYRIIEKIGAGGMGEIYLAEDTKLKRKIALKFLPTHLCNDEDCIKRFKREAQASAQLNHPNIVTIYEVSEFQGRSYFSMEHIAGESLGDLIRASQLSIDRIIDLAIQICEGLNKAHQANITHRDIKPANIMIDSDDRPKLLDFGLATVQDATQLTQAGSTLGTIGYMSPEQIQAKKIDHRSDLFSFGAVLYEMISAKRAFGNTNTAATLNAILNEEPACLSTYRDDVPVNLLSIVNKAMKKDVEMRYQSVELLLEDLIGLRDDKNIEIADSYGRQPRKLVKRATLSGAIVVTVAILLLLQPWNIRIERTQPVEAAQSLLAVIPFFNVKDISDSNKTAQMITSLMIADLSESQYLRVVNRQRLYDVLESMGKEKIKQIDRSTASEIARKTNARWMLTGDVVQTSPNIVLTADISETATGRTLATQSISGEVGEDLFTVVDRLTAEVKEDLDLPEASRSEDDLAVADVTTHSPQAYRHYLEGIDFMRKFYFPEARRSFLKALQFDSTFAMVYFQLAGLFTLSAEKKIMIDKALQYSDKCGRKEKHLILGRQAYMEGRYKQGLKEYMAVLKLDRDDKEILMTVASILSGTPGKQSESIEYFERVIQMDPNLGNAYNYLSYVYGKLGLLDTAIQLNSKYVDLSFNEANPYDSRGELYAMNGEIDLAIEAYKKALEIKPDFILSNINLGHMYLFKRDYVNAEKHYRAVAVGESKADRALTKMMLAYIPAHKGQFKKAIEILNATITTDELEEFKGQSYFETHFVKSTIYLEQQDWQKMRETIDTVLLLHDKVFARDEIGVRDFYPYMLAKSGDTTLARQIVDGLKEDFLDTELRSVYAYWEAIGSIELVSGDPDKAVEYLEKAAEYAYSHSFHLEFILSEAYLNAEKYDLAIARLEKALKTYEYNRAFHAPLAVRAHYMLGLAYEGSDWNEKAIEKYEEFLDIWKDVDSGIEAVDDAKTRLLKLKKSSS